MLSSVISKIATFLKLRIERVWAMPNKWTFTIKPIKKLLQEEMNGGLWADPYAGMNSPAQITNDINPDSPSKYHLDATEFLKLQIENSFDGVLYDPPYSAHQSNISYQIECKGLNRKQAAVHKDEISRIVKPGGKSIWFGWNSNGVGMSRGFELERILLIAHGGSHNDTIVTVERKVNETL